MATDSASAFASDSASASASASEGIAAHPAVQRVRQALTDRGAEGAVTILPGSARTAAEAADQLGIQVGQIANSLVFAVDPPGDTAVVLVLTSGRHRVDTGLVAGILDATRVTRAGADLVRSASGFAIGGVAPVGHPHRLPTIVDVALGDYDQVWAAAGHPYAVFPTSFQELIALTGGTAGVVSSEG